MFVRQMGHLFDWTRSWRAQSEHMHMCRHGSTVVSRASVMQITHSREPSPSPSPSPPSAAAAALESCPLHFTSDGGAGGDMGVVGDMGVMPAVVVDFDGFVAMIEETLQTRGFSIATNVAKVSSSFRKASSLENRSREKGLSELGRHAATASPSPPPIFEAAEAKE
mmetsp:Transcript_43190/g.114261  ORF Transcript_43190/g.114261 Transcript_43190/m.114261 type:complete len:166 (-) Transcript_43190:608-1105(-)